MKDKIKRQNIILTLILFLFSLTIGYALLNQNISLNGSTSIPSNSWNIHFVPTSYTESNGSVAGTVSFTNNNTKLVFNDTLSIPGDIYEFTIDVINDGGIDGMLDVTPTLSIVDNKGTSDTSDDVSYTNTNIITSSITYSDGTPLNQYDELKVGDTLTYKIRIEFKKNIENTDLQNLPLHLTCNLNPIYIQADSNAKEVTNLKTGCYIPETESSGDLGTIIANSNTLNRVIQDLTQGSDSSIDFKQAAFETNTNGVYTRATTTNDKYPIYYFRGNVTNNNVIFNNFCWKIVRTTEYGGVKMIYNGVPTNGVCPSTGDPNTSIGISAFNSSYNNPKYVGYMYKTTNENDTNSTIKIYIDNWYQNNFLGKPAESKLDNTVTFCNDRDETTAYGYMKIGANLKKMTIEELKESMGEQYGIVYNSVEIGEWIGYCSFYRASAGQPSIECTNTSDNFGTNGHGNSKLTYPIGLLTSDEVMLAGNNVELNNSSTYNTTYYLYNSSKFFLSSPIEFKSNGVAIMNNVDFGYSLSQYYTVTALFGVRPVISIKFNTSIESGNGTTSSPYIIS